MPTVYVMGYVEPKELRLCIEGMTPVIWEDIKTKERYSYLVTILECIVSVECVIDKFEDTETFISQLSNRAADMTRLVVDLLSFRSGLGATVYINEFIDPEGREHRLIHHSGGIKCTAYDESEVGEIFHAFSPDTAFAESLNDLILAISTPHHAPVNCGRAVEGIRRLIDPNPNKRAAWKTMRETLNLGENYALDVYKRSTAPRHGDRTYPLVAEVEDSIRRSWLIMDRYIHYKRLGSQPLPRDKFSLLT